ATVAFSSGLLVDEQQQQRRPSRRRPAAGLPLDTSVCSEESSLSPFGASLFSLRSGGVVSLSVRRQPLLSLFRRRRLFSLCSAAAF
ncbi:hypothetical protein LINPERPRIM_LOCUS4697, partial [Linum perenne]